MCGSERRRAGGGLLALGVLGVVLGAVLGGCAPVADFRPASGLMEGRRYEAGGGGAAVSPRPFVTTDRWRGTGQLWAAGRTRVRWLSWAGLFAFDAEAAAGGGALRATYVRTDRVAGAVELQGGWLWAGASLPFALRLFDDTWVYTAPRVFNLGDEATVALPLGVSVRVWDGLMVRAEGAVGWGGFRYYERRWQVGLGVAYQFAPGDASDEPTTSK